MTTFIDQSEILVSRSARFFAIRGEENVLGQWVSVDRAEQRGKSWNVTFRGILPQCLPFFDAIHGSDVHMLSGRHGNPSWYIPEMVAAKLNGCLEIGRAVDHLSDMVKDWETTLLVDVVCDFEFVAGWKP